MPQDGDGVVIGVTKAPFMSRGGCCVRQDDSGDEHRDGGVHGKKVRGDRALMLSSTVRISCFVASSGCA
jgi:hypothetical protein